MRRQIQERNFIALGAYFVFMRNGEQSYLKYVRQDRVSEMVRNILLF